MLKDIVSVKPLEGYRLHLRFEDGVEGIVDVAALVEFKGVFEPLKDKKEFYKVRLNPELGIIEWECGADTDPDVLYAHITKEAIPDYSKKARTL